MDEHEVDYKRFGADRIISVSDLIEEILRKIWLIIILAAVCAVLCAGYKYMSDKSKAEASANADSYTKEAASLTDEEMREVNSILMLYDEVEAQERYMDESIMMNIDPYHEERVSMLFSLRSEESSVTDLLQLMGNYVLGGALVEDLQEHDIDVDRIYLAELIDFTQGQLDEETSEADVDVETEEIKYGSSVFTVEVIEADEYAAVNLADAVQQCIASYAGNLVNQFGYCELTLVNQSVTQVYDSNLKNTQNNAVSDQISLQNKINTQTEELSDEQVSVLEAALAQETDSDITVEESATEPTTLKVHISRRYTLLGILIGIVLGIILIALYYIWRGTLNIAQELSGVFQISVFGQIHVKKQRNPLVRAWRRLCRRKKPLSLETEQKIALTNLENYCKNHQINKILLIGTQWELSEDTWLKEVQSALGSEGIETEIAGGLPDSLEALENLNDYDDVTLVETLHTSLYRDVVREVEVCSEQRIKIVGAILFI